MAEKKDKKSRRTPDRSAYLNHRAHAVVETLPDGCQIRALMVPKTHAVTRFSLIEISVPAGLETTEQQDAACEKVWHILNGAGLMYRGDEQFAVVPGDVIHIAPGLPHRILCIGKQPLQLLCVCAPPEPGENPTDFPT